MQNLDNDMDELFRKAVDQYPLKPCDNKWDEISGKITSNSNPSLLSGKFSDSVYLNRTTQITLLLLLLAATIIHFPENKEINFSNTPAAETNNQKSEINENKTNPNNQINALNSTNDVTGSHASSVAKMYPVHRESPVMTKDELPAAVPEKKEFSPQNISSNVLSANAQENTVSQKETVNLIESTHSFTDPADYNYSLQKKTPIVLNHPVPVSNQQALQHLDAPRRRGFYFGLSFGPMLSDGKNFSKSKTGFDFGILAGYTVNNKISIETGILRTKQYYFMSGKNYNEFSGRTDANALEGNREAFNIHLHLNYTVLPMKKGDVYLSAGFSSYLGVNDKILINVNNNSAVHPEPINYSSTGYLPSYLDLGLGYSYKIGKFANIRVEPYLQIPLKSAPGNSVYTNNTAGAIPVTNMGIHLEITRFIH